MRVTCHTLGRRVRGPLLAPRRVHSLASVPRITLGPIIGAVSAHKANVMLEVNEDAHVEVSLTKVNGGNAVAKQRAHLTAWKPHTFVLDQLPPDTALHVSVSGASPEPRADDGVDQRLDHALGSVHTMPTHFTDLRVAVLSCNNPVAGNAKPCLWQRLWDAVRAPARAPALHLCIHNGDSIYARRHDPQSVYERSMEALRQWKAGDTTVEEARRRIHDAYASEYRRMWTAPWTRLVLAHVPNLMGHSDGEIFNDYTVIHPPPDQLHLETALSAYRSYCRRLWDPQLGETRVGSGEWHFHTWGPFGVLYVDTRSSRMPHEHQLRYDEPFVGQDQRDFIRKAMHDTPGLRWVMVVSETPVALNGVKETKAKVGQLTMLRDYWGYHETSLRWLLDTVFDWIADAPGERDALLVGGDCHQSVQSVIRRDRDGVHVDQVIATPITQRPSSFEVPKRQHLTHDYSFEHNLVLPYTRTVGWVQAHVAPGAAPRHQIDFLQEPTQHGLDA